jgi:hypothetical protein
MVTWSCRAKVERRLAEPEKETTAMSEKKKIGFWDAIGMVAKKTFTSEKADPLEALTDAAKEVGTELRDDVKRELDREAQLSQGVVETTAEPATVDEGAKKTGTTG